MPPRIGEILTMPPRAPFPDPAKAGLDVLRSSFVLTAETGEICARLLKHLVQPPGRNAPFLFSGERGVGKTHLLRFLEALLQQPEAAEWAALAPYVGVGERPSSPLRTLYAALPVNPGVDLDRFLFEVLASVSAAPEQDAVAEAGSAPTPRNLRLIVLDDVSRRLERVDADAAAKDLRLLKMVTEKFAGAGIATVLVADARPSSAHGQVAGVLEPLVASCDFLFISRNSIREIVAGLSTRSEQQGAQVRAVLDGLRQRVLSISPKIESFVELYPIHPAVFDLFFKARAHVAGFSPLDFARAAMEAAKERAANDLVTLDVLFDTLAGPLASSERHASLLAAFETFRSEVLRRMKDETRSRGEALLKGITLLTALDEEADVKTLAEALLLYDPEGVLSSPSFTSALLVEMEQKGGDYLVVEGEAFDRAYRLLDKAAQATTLGREIVEREEPFPRELPRLLADWVGSQIPNWSPDVSDRFHDASQLVEAPLPGGGAPSGMIYFKNLADPLWSGQDADALLRETPYAWIILILNPFERFYEIEREMRELTGKLPRLAIWKPRAPAGNESEALRWAAQQLASSGPRGARASRAEKLIWSQAQVAIEELFGTLFVQGGELWTHAGTRRVTEVAGTQTLAAGLAATLSSLAAHVPQPPRAAKPIATPEGGKITSQWAALFLGGPPPPAVEDAERAVLAWWHEIEEPGLPVRLRSLPDSFLTNRFWREVQAYERTRGLLALHFERLRRGDVKFDDAMIQAARDFNMEGERVVAWKEMHARLSDVVAWSQTLERARNYLHSSVPTGQEKLEKLRSELLDETSQPHLFLEQAARMRFEERLAYYKKGYVDFYYAAHEDALNIVGNPERLETKVDYIALRNLELLSKLHYTDKSYLHRVRIKGEWIQVQQCSLPVRAILDRNPRCYCNFNPSTSRLAGYVAELNTAIRDGIEYFRAILRKCNMIVIQELKAMHVDDFHSRQIAALLSRGAMIPLKPQSIDILNRIIQAHPADFLAEIRSYKAQS